MTYHYSMLCSSIAFVYFTLRESAGVFAKDEQVLYTQLAHHYPRCLNFEVITLRRERQEEITGTER
jgi:hypothetical protein